MMPYNIPSNERGVKPDDGICTGNPFVPASGSDQFRIPALVTMNDGTVVAAADARWNTHADGCGLDTIVSVSEDNGKTWRYTFANYLGDNGNRMNRLSTTFIDPLLTVHGDTICLLVDLFPG
ncbi:MAG: exo-alpha-sialidase, partial [Clostridia bacterium]|nr:exo-alpha-sialidase [Clostridia bacterium]